MQSIVISFFMNVCADLLINEDGKFVHALQDVLESDKTFYIFKLHRKKKNQSYKARRSVKKHIANVSNNADFEQEDKGNIFDILENT